MRKYLLSLALVALAKGFLYAGIATTDDLMEVLWFTEAVTAEKTGWTGDGLSYADAKYTLDAEEAVTFTPANASTGTAVRQVFDIAPEPVAELPEVDEGVQTALVLTEEGVYKAWGKATKDAGEATWNTLGAKTEGTIALEIDYATAPATIRYYQGDDQLGATIFSANDKTSVTQYDFTGTGTIASISGTQTAATAAIVDGVKKGADDFTTDDLIAAIAAGKTVKIYDKNFTAPDGYEINADGYLVAASIPLPQANVATLDAKAQTDLEGNPVALDAAFKFTTVEPSEKTLDAYGEWEANFEVSFNQDIAEGSVALKGTYEGFGQVFDWQEMPMTGALKAGDVWTLLPANQVTYADVLKIGTFTCGLKNLSDDNTDATVTVKLVLKNGEQRIEITKTTNDLIETEALKSAVASELIAAGKTTVKLANGATFTYDQVPEDAQAITIKTTGKVTIVGDAETKPVVDNISVVGEGATVAYENVTKVFTAYPTADEQTMLKNADAWKNCVAYLKDIPYVNTGIDLNNFGNATSVIRMTNCEMWLPNNVNVAVPVELVKGTSDNALYINGASYADYKFAKLSGDGKLKIHAASNGYGKAFMIADASDFTGSIETDCPNVYLNATTGERSESATIVVNDEVAVSGTLKATTIQVNGTLTATADQLKATSITGAGLVDLSSKDYVDAELTVLEKMASTLTAKVNNFKGYFSGGVAGDDYVVTVPPTIEILGTFEVSGGYSRTPNWKGVISKIKGGEDAVFKVSINVGGRCDIEIGNLDDYAGTLALANNSWLILPNGDVAVDGAKAKFADATKSTYTTKVNDAIAAAQTGTTATGVTIFDATGVTVPDGYTLAADGTLTRKLYYKEMTNTGKATDWYNVDGIKFADVNGAEMTYTEGDTIVINKSLVAYMHDGMNGAKLAVEGENTVQIIRSGDGSGADYALKGVALTIGEDATVVVPCCEVNGWNSYATSKAAQSEFNGVTIDGAGTLVVPTRTDKSGNSAPAKMVLTNTTIADTVTVTLDEGATIVVDANSSMPEPTVGTTTTTGAKLLTSTEGGVTTYTVGVEQSEFEWKDVTETTPIEDVVPGITTAQAAVLTEAGVKPTDIATWAAAHAAGTKPGDELNLAAFALNLDNDATETEIEAAAENLTVTIEMVDGKPKASVVLKNGLTVNVEPVMKGKENLTDAEWSADLTGKKFFKAFIDL